LRCCVSGTEEHCRECALQGCKECEEGYFVNTDLTAPACEQQKNPGERCEGIRFECRSGPDACPGRDFCCRSDIMTGCGSCKAGTGDCAECVSTSQFPDPDSSSLCTDKVELGMDCFLNDGTTPWNPKCRFGECSLGGTCCLSSSVTGCAVCGTNGACEQCVADFILVEGLCLGPRNVGETCDEEVGVLCRREAGDCVGGVCCEPGAEADCQECGALNWNVFFLRECVFPRFRRIVHCCLRGRSFVRIQ